MRRLPLVLLVVALALGFASVVGAPAAPPAGRIVLVPTASNAFPCPGLFNCNYSDPASDVFILYSSNNSHVTDSAGNWLYSSTEPQVNIVRTFTVNATGSIGVYLRVQGGGTISNLPNTSYEWHLYTRLDNATHFILRYSAGVTTLRLNTTGSTVYNLTANTTISPAYQLGVTVSKADLGNITRWNLDATAKMVGSYTTFEDFGWLQPGNPGSAPAYIQGRVTDAANGAGLASVNVSAGTGGYFTATNATGYYSLPAAPGNFTLTFTLSGYDSVTKAVSVSEQQTQTVNAQMSKTSTLGSDLIWIVLIVVVVAAVVVVVLLMRRRRKPSAPK